MWCRVFVNGRGRDAIMEDMRRRIERGDVRLERGEAVDVCFSLSALPQYCQWLGFEC